MLNKSCSKQHCSQGTRQSQGIWVLFSTLPKSDVMMGHFLHLLESPFSCLQSRRNCRCFAVQLQKCRVVVKDLLLLFTITFSITIFSCYTVIPTYDLLVNRVIEKFLSNFDILSLSVETGHNWMYTVLSRDWDAHISNFLAIGNRENGMSPMYESPESWPNHPAFKQELVVE